MYVWPAFAYTVMYLPGPGAPQLSSWPEVSGALSSPPAASA